MAGWKVKKDPLFRGDVRGGVQLPSPSANTSIVRHILYLDGFGRPTPYLSTTEIREIADRFASRGGHLYEAWPREWHERDVRHLPRTELLLNLRGKGKGRAAWHSALEVMQARRYVEENAEHLADFSGLPEEGLRERVDAIFPPGRS